MATLVEFCAEGIEVFLRSSDMFFVAAERLMTREGCLSWMIIASVNDRNPVGDS